MNDDEAGSSLGPDVSANVKRTFKYDDWGHLVDSTDPSGIFGSKDRSRWKGALWMGRSPLMPNISQQRLALLALAEAAGIRVNKPAGCTWRKIAGQVCFSTNRRGTTLSSAQAATSRRCKSGRSGDQRSRVGRAIACQACAQLRSTRRQIVCFRGTGRSHGSRDVTNVT